MSDKIDISPEAVEQLARDLPNSQWQAPNLHLARETLRALRARLEAVEKERDDLQTFLTGRDHATASARAVSRALRRMNTADARAERAEAALATARRDAVGLCRNIAMQALTGDADGRDIYEQIDALANEAETPARGMP